MIYVKITPRLSGSKIYYTTNGEDPTKENSTEYEEPFGVYKNCTVKAIAVKDEWLPSDITETEIKVHCPIPILKIRAGSNIDNCYVLLENPEDYEEITDAKILYTLDGTDPTEETEEFILPNGSVYLERNLTFKALAVSTSNAESVEIATIEVSDLRCQDPVVVSSFIRAEGHVEVNATSPTKDSVIHYTTTGVDPTEQDAVYDTPLELAENCTLKMASFKEGLLTSNTVETTIVARLILPVLEFNEETKIVSITNLDSYNLEETQFRYSLDGSDPKESSLVYDLEKGILVENGETVKLVAISVSGLFSDTVELATKKDDDTAIVGKAIVGKARVGKGE